MTPTVLDAEPRSSTKRSMVDVLVPRWVDSSHQASRAANSEDANIVWVVTEGESSRLGSTSNGKKSFLQENRIYASSSEKRSFSTSPAAGEKVQNCCMSSEFLAKG